MGRAQNTVKRGSFWRPGVSAAGAAAPLSYGEERTAYGYATARGPLAGFKRLRATAGQGPNYVGPSCGYMLAYVGLSCGQRGPILWLCWTMFAACWPMLSQKIRKMGTATKRCKTQDILMVGGLSWPIFRALWAHLGAILAHLGAILAHLGAMLAHLGAMLAQLGGYVGPSWSYVGPS